MRRVETRVRANDYRSIDAPALGSWQPRLRVSVVIPVYRAQEELERTLAALERQTYPSELYEVVVVDDGSEPPIEAPPFAGSLSLIAQERDGFGAARARNRGAADSTGEVLLFLDADMIPERTWIEGHARWHHMSEDIVTMGRRAHIDPSGISPEDLRSDRTVADVVGDRPAPRPPWLEAHFDRTNELLDDSGDLFRVVTSGNLGVSRAMFDHIGGFEESFRQWGGEDTEFGYRAYVSGAVLVPEPGAFCWHQGPGIEPDAGEMESLAFQRVRLSHRIAHPGFRDAKAGRSFAVPRVTIVVDGTGSDAGAAEVGAQLDAVLASDQYDLTVGVKGFGEEAQRWLDAAFGGDPRYTGDADPEALHPFSQLRLELPAGLVVGPAVVRRLVNAAGSVGVVTVQTAHGQVRMGQTRALQRVGVNAPTRWEDAARVFGHKEIRAFDLDLSSARVPWADRLPGPLGKVIARFRGIRSWNDLMVTVRWLLAGARATLGLRSKKRLGLAHRDEARLDPPPLPGIYSTGAEGFERLPVMLGPRADLAYGVEAPDPKVLTQLSEAGGVFLQLDDGPNPLRVPPFDPRRFNPSGWLPTDDGLDKDFARIPQPSMELRSHRSVALPPPTTPEEAAAIAIHCALGVVVRAGAPGPWKEWLGDRLGGLIEDDEPLDDRTTRERRSVRLRRAAHGDHSIYARRAQLRREAGVPDIGVETVSVLLVTNRSELVVPAVEGIAAQTHRPLEIVVGLHGIERPDGLGSHVAGVPVVVVEGAGEMLYGDFLNVATAACSGEWILKMDDDDHYSPDHVEDLVIASRYSGADLVGKGAEFIHLESKGVTVRRLAGDPESGSRTISGAALGIRRSALRRAGGWARVARGVDQTLIAAVLETGGSIYRTHGFGFVVRRSATGHTWSKGDEYFLKQAMETYDGLEAHQSDLAPRLR